MDGGYTRGQRIGLDENQTLPGGQKGQMMKIKDGEHIDRIESGVYVLENGTATIGEVAGGEVQSWENSTITIDTVIGGKVRAWENSVMTIGTVTDGEVQSWERSTITIGTVTDGEVWSRENSVMTIKKDTRKLQNAVNAAGRTNYEAKDIQTG